MLTDSISLIKSLKGYLELCDAAFKVAFKLATAFGLVLILCYCIRIDFYPKSLTVGDAVLFLFSILSFGFLEVLGVLYGATSTLWILSLLFRFLSGHAKHRFTDETTDAKFSVRYTKNFRQVRLRKGVRGKSTFLFSLFTSALFLYILAIVYSNPHQANAEQIIRLFISLLGGGAIINVALAFESAPKPNSLNNENRYIRFFALPLFALLFPLLFGGAGFLTDVSMRMIGVRVENTPIILGEKGFKFVNNLAKKYRIPLTDCGAGPSEEHIVYGADILWHSIGSIARLRLGAADQNERKVGKSFVEFNLDDAEVQAMKSSSTIKCDEMKNI